jgi:hypothetical protein
MLEIEVRTSKSKRPSMNILTLTKFATVVNDRVVRINITNIPWGKMSTEKYGITVRNSLNVLLFIFAFMAIVIAL